MKKIYLTLLLLTFVGSSVFSQSDIMEDRVAPVLKHAVAPRIDIEVHTDINASRSGGSIWEDDFSTPGNWVTGYDATACDIEWEIGTGLSTGGGAPIATILSTTAANGFAMIDSDEYGGANGGTCVEDSWFTTANSINLSAYSNVVVEFETWYRRWNYELPYLVISTDGVTWPDLTPDTDISGMPNVFNVWPGFPDATSLAQNPTVMTVDISDVAGNQPQVWIRFHWTGTWGYAWFVDDVKILEQPANDLASTSAYISHDGTGNEYGRIPQSQLLSDFYVGGSFDNIGSAVQNNVVAIMSFEGPSGLFMEQTNFAQAPAGSTNFMDEIITVTQLPLDTGLYEGTFGVVSDEEGILAPTFGNNTYERNFSVTENAYTLDGLGVHPAGSEVLEALGTASFTGGDDGLMIFTYYSFTQTTNIVGIQILLANGTVPGGNMFVSVHDTTDILTTGDVYNPLVQTTATVTQLDIDNGFVFVLLPFTTGVGAFYIGVELFSNGNANNIVILGDETVPQPVISSLIYIPSDQVYSNGNAMGIRVITDDVLVVGVEEQEELAGINIYPNPTEGMIQIDVKNQGVHTIEVMNVIGKQVYTASVSSDTTIDLKKFGAGLYMVRVSAGNETFTERTIVH